MKTKIKKLIEKCINEYGLIVNIGYKFNNVFRHHLDIKSWLAKNYTNIPLVEALYMIHYNLKERPKCKYCNKNEVRFINFIDGYKKCCCAECTNMLKYGVKNISQLPEIKEKMLSTFKTNYGSLGRKNPIILEKTKNTILKKYNGNYQQTLEYKEKCKKTNILKYRFRTFYENKRR